MQAMRACGMTLVGVSRLAYAEKETDEFKEWLHSQLGDFYLIPEGGSNFLGVNGCMEILSAQELNEVDVIVCASGTGSTAAGLLLGCPEQRILSVPVLRPELEMYHEVRKQLVYFLGEEIAVNECMDRLEIIPGYTHGGYARVTTELMSFISAFEQKYQIPLDAVYTGKMMQAVFTLANQGYFKDSMRVVVIHTGGLRGRCCGDVHSYREK
jgi:1-aminocyclopropane-1-carboxylate deaminase/D-cysteine desulfhydrase-like pyridoxal-dependent ACC family enzyme